MNGTTRVLEAGVVAKYVLGDPLAPWHGGSASLTTEFIKKNPGRGEEVTSPPTRKGVELVRTKPDEARQYLKGYTAIEGPLTAEVPLAAYMLYNEFKPSDVAYFQKFFDLFTDKGIFEKQRGRRADCSTRGEPWPTPRCAGTPRRWRPAGRRVAAARRRKTFALGHGCCPSSGRSLLFIVWDLVVRAGLHQADPAAHARRHARRRWSPAWPAGRCSPTSWSPSSARSRPS